jgi:uncharacterized membrane protein
MWISWIVIAAAIVFVLWLAARAPWRYDPAEGEELLDLLRQRYASGAISEEEYFKRLAILQRKLR